MPDGGLDGSTSGACSGTVGISGTSDDDIVGPTTPARPGAPGIGTSTPGGVSNSGGLSMLDTSYGGRFVPAGTSAGIRSIPGALAGVWPKTSGGEGVALVQRTPPRPAEGGDSRCVLERMTCATADATAWKAEAAATLFPLCLCALLSWSGEADWQRRARSRGWTFVWPLGACVDLNSRRQNVQV